MKPGKWIELRDDAGEMLEFRDLGNKCYQFIQITDMDDACGRDNEGNPKYVAELSLVDLSAVSPAAIKSAMDSCGWEDMPLEDAAIAECLFQYGNRAPLFSESSNNRTKAHRLARSEAKSLLDGAYLADAMERPVNALGSTAAEYMRGDLDSAMARGVYAGDPTARIVAKMHGIPSEVIDDARPADWLPYMMGYMAGNRGDARETGDDLAPEYNQGFDRGVKVRSGECPAPSWIK